MKDLRTLDSYRDKEMERKLYHSIGDGGNGCFKVFVNGHSFFAVVSNGGGWDHVSITPCNLKRNTCPTWEEMCAIKEMFFEPEECVVQYHPAKSDYVDLHPYCLHLWRPNDGRQIITPPKLYV